MADTETNAPKKGASGANWSDAERLAYLLVLMENGGQVEAKVATAPVPVGRSIISCKKMIGRLKEKYKDDMEKIKAGQPITPTGGEGEAATPGSKSKAPRKRKSQGAANGGSEVTEGGVADTDGSPNKRGRKKKDEAKTEEIQVKTEVKDDEFMGGLLGEF